MRWIRISLALAAVHLLLTAGALLVSLDASVAQASEAPVAAPAQGGVAEALASVLSQPGASLWPAAASGAPGAGRDWTASAANSLLWGLPLGALLAFATRRRSAPRAAGQGAP